MKTRAAGLAFFIVWLAIAHAQLASELREGFTYALLAIFGAALGLGIASPRLSRALAQAIERPPTWAFLLASSLLAAGITLWLALSPMRGQTASLDGSVYVFQARALANLSYGFPIPPPKLPFGLRFLFEGADGNLHGVFPVGYPLFLAPFIALGSFILAAPVMAALMVVAQYWLAKTIVPSEALARLSVLLSLPSWARAIETAEPISHPLVGVMVALAIVCAFRLQTSTKPWRLALLLGISAGWAFSARLLDGIVLGIVLGPVLLFWAYRRIIPRRAIALIALGTLPFIALLMGQHLAGSGSLHRPNVSEYAARSDWPPNCLRLGIGEDVGCTVEHPLEVAAFGPDGYQLDDALRLVKERAEALGPDLVGSSLLFLLAFVPLLINPSRDEKGLKIAGAFLIALTLAYGLYYYGNHPIWGARHLFPAAPLVWTLIALSISRLPRYRERSLQSAAGFALLFTITVASFPMWERGLERVRHDQRNRVDLRALVDDHRVDRGIIATFDVLSLLVGYDPWVDRGNRFLVLDSPHGAHDLRALRPQLPVYEASPPGDLTLVEPKAPSEGTFSIELERAWPSFQRPERLGATAVHTLPLFDVRASAEHALYVFESEPGASLTIPIWVPKNGSYSIQLYSIKGPDHGDYKVMVDDHILPLHRGYSPEHRRASSARSIPIALEAGHHTLSFICLGKQRESSGYKAVFDVLVGRRE